VRLLLLGAELDDTAVPWRVREPPRRWAGPSSGGSRGNPLKAWRPGFVGSRSPSLPVGVARSWGQGWPGATRRAWPWPRRGRRHAVRAGGALMLRPRARGRAAGRVGARRRPGRASRARS